MSRMKDEPRGLFYLKTFACGLPVVFVILGIWGVTALHPKEIGVIAGSCVALILATCATFWLGYLVRTKLFGESWW